MNITIDDLFYLYSKNGTTQVALRGLNLSVNSGECLVITGPNGSGKSTLVKILTGNQRPTAGKVYFNGLDITSISTEELRRSHVSSIDQKGNLLEDFTIGEFLTLSRTVANYPLKKSISWAKGILAEYGLENLFNSFPKEVSSGERQISSLLAALASEPSILVADEPSGELDDLSSTKMYDALKMLSGRVTLLIVTHDSRAEAIADKVVRIHKGRVSEMWLPGEAEIPVSDPFGWVRVPLAAQHNTAIRKFSPLDQSPVLRSEDVGFTVGGRNLFSDVDLTVDRGELVLITGNSGSGKSSLLKVLAGLESPSSGTVSIFNQDLSELPEIELLNLRFTSIGYLAQGRGPFERLSLISHLEGNQELLKGDFASRLEDSLSTFSGGERARIEILKLLSSGKKLLFLDEPTSSLDEERAQEIVEMLLDFVEDGGVAIIASREESLLNSATQILNLSTSALKN